MRLPFCSQKEKRDENAMLAGLPSWAVTHERGDRVKRRQRDSKAMTGLGEDKNE